MLIGYSLIQFDGGRLAGYGEPPERTGPDRAWVIYILSLLSIPIFWLIFRNVMNTHEAAAGSGLWGYIVATPFLGKVLFVTFLAAVIGIPIWSYRVGNKAEFQMMLAAIILVVFNVTFWTLFEQAASSLTLFADRNTTLELFGIFVSAPQTQNFNPITIVIFAPIMSWLWIALGEEGARTVDPGEVRHRPASGRSWLRRSFMEHRHGQCRLPGRLMVAGVDLFPSFDRRAVHFTGGSQHDHQAVALPAWSE